MTGGPLRAHGAPPLLAARVELGEGATVHIEVAEGDADRLSQRLLADLFAVGLNVPEPVSPPRGPTFPRLTLDGDVHFLLGAYDIGPERGLEVVARGVHHVIDVGLREYREPDHQPQHVQPTGDQTTRLSREESGMPVDEPEVVVEVDELAASLPALLKDASRGAHVILTEDGKRVAALVSWSWYSLQRERLARSAAAYWKAWRDGTFDGLGYAVEVVAALAPDDGPAPPAPADPVPGSGRDDDSD